MSCPCPCPCPLFVKSSFSVCPETVKITQIHACIQVKREGKEMVEEGRAYIMKKMHKGGVRRQNTGMK